MRKHLKRIYDMDLIVVHGISASPAQEIVMECNTDMSRFLDEMRYHEQKVKYLERKVAKLGFQLSLA